MNACFQYGHLRTSYRSSYTKANGEECAKLTDKSLCYSIVKPTSDNQSLQPPHLGGTHCVSISLIYYQLLAEVSQTMQLLISQIMSQS